MEETSQINTEWVSYLVGCDGNIEKQKGRIKLELKFKLLAKINSKWFKGLSVKGKTVKLLEENLETVSVFFY